MNTNHILIILSINHIAISETPKMACLPQNPFQTDSNCGDFNDVCVKKDDLHCNNFQAACQQCPPTNYTVSMLLHLNSQLSRSNLNKNEIKNQINILSSLINVSLNKIVKQSTDQVGIGTVCLIFILLNFIFDIFVFLKESSKESQCLINNNQQIMYSDEKSQNITNENKEFLKEIKKIINEKDETFSNEKYNSLNKQFNNINNLEMSEFEKCFKNINKFNKYYKSEIVNCFINKSSLNEEMKLSLNCLYVSINIISKYIEDHQPSICVSDYNLVCTFDGFSDMISSNHLAERICESILYAMCSLMKLSENEVNKEFWRKKLEKLFLSDKISEENKLASCFILVQLDISNEYLINKLFEYLDKIMNIDCQDYFGFSESEITSAKKKLANKRKTTINTNKDEKYEQFINEKFINFIEDEILSKEIKEKKTSELLKNIKHRVHDIVNTIVLSWKRKSHYSGIHHSPRVKTSVKAISYIYSDTYKYDNSIQS